ncbi:MAG: LapA family protein [Phycisphaerae bacterium]|nr:LapA family protein [Phycisphaerae bacterium]
MKNFKMISVVVVSLLVLIIALQNTQSVETKLLFVTVTMPRAFLLFITFVFGFVFGSAAVVSYSNRTRKKEEEA